MSIIYSMKKIVVKATKNIKASDKNSRYLEYDPTDIPKLINPIKNGNADVVYEIHFLFYWPKNL